MKDNWEKVNLAFSEMLEDQRMNLAERDSGWNSVRLHSENNFYVTFVVDFFYAHESFSAGLVNFRHLYGVFVFLLN